MADVSDDYFRDPFIDIDEQRALPVPHRYVHGGFRGTETRFSFSFPPADVYRGRFFQHVTPVPQSENLAPDVDGPHNKVTFAIASGAYFVETNGGGPDAANPMSGLDPTIGAYRANAAAAEVSRTVAASLYGEHRPFGYLYGGSGGAYRTIGAAENTRGVWDGFVPYVPGSPMAIPSVFSVRMHAQRVLRDALPRIVDAFDAGGEVGALDLNVEERAAFDEVTRMGFPPRSWFGWRTMGMHAFSVIYPGVMAADPTYAEDFWSTEGYLGADPDAEVHRDRLRFETSVAGLVTDGRLDEPTGGGVDESFLHSASAGDVVTALRLADTARDTLLGSELSVLTGASAGAKVRLSAFEGGIASLEPGQGNAISGVAVGDRVRVDNSNFLAAQTYHRHQVPDVEYAVWDQFRDESKQPIPPQRSMLLGPLFTRSSVGSLPTGDIDAKMIVVACTLDRESFPWQADWYRTQVAAHAGESTTGEFRLWYIDNALHGDAAEQEFPDRTVSYLGALETALRQLVSWVEDGVEPAPTTSYAIEDGQVVLEPRADERGGVQPVVSLTVDGRPTTRVRVGQDVTLGVDVQTPGAGVVVDVSVGEAGSEGVAVDGIEHGSSVRMQLSRSFDSPGTYLLWARAVTQTAGDGTDLHARVENIARARVVVDP